jgi:hypothetical protein
VNIFKPIRKRRKATKSSLRYEVINGQYRKYPDGRLVAQNTPRGREWYRQQTILMAERQGWKCGLIGICLRQEYFMADPRHDPLSPFAATFEHGDKRGMGAARQNDDPNAPGNVAAHFCCNSELGSRRLSKEKP